MLLPSDRAGIEIVLMVVFGAGASYDSVPVRPARHWREDGLHARPPLANQLFDERPLFADAISRFPRCQPIIPLLRHLLPNTSVEQVLERLQEEANHYRERHRQLAAIRYYLHFALWECERQWESVAQGVTNHKTLLDTIERWRKPEESVCLVTFNYERLLEKSLPVVGVQIGNLSDYISNQRYQLIKLHGSVDWAREVNTPIEKINEYNPWQVAYELIENASDLDISQRYRMVAEHPIGKVGQIALFPALTIPVETKRSFECPHEHFEAVQAFVPKVTRLLVIGWRATERPFLQLLREYLPRSLRVMVVAGNPDGARQVLEVLREAGVDGQFAAAPGGFTDFVVRREADEFLRS